MEDDIDQLIEAASQQPPKSVPRSAMSRRSVATTGRRVKINDEVDIREMESNDEFAYEEGLRDSDAPSTSSTAKIPLFDPDREPIQVYLRIRPQLSELEKREEDCVIPSGEQVVTLRMPESSQMYKLKEREVESRYLFSKVFSPNVTQEEVFSDTGKVLVKALFENKNSLLFAYGITNSGKTHTIQGSASDAGVLPRVLTSLFDNIHQSNASDYQVMVNYYEIYNEQIFDLLEDIPTEPLAFGEKPYRRKVLQMKEGKDGRVVVQNLQSVEIHSPEEGQAVIDRGLQNRRVGDTQIHSDSSRSHSVFSIKLIKKATTQKPTYLSIVDLAGSERTSKTQNTGARLKETCNINSSLMVLGRCMQALRYNQLHPFKPAKLVPYRDSKLTRLFHDTMMNGRAVMIATVNASPSYYEETYYSLKFTAITRDVTTVANAEQAKQSAAARQRQQSGQTKDVFSTSEYLQLQERVRELEDTMVEMQQRYAGLEMSVREEVSSEMADSLAEMEAECQQRIDAEVQSANAVFTSKLMTMTSADSAAAELALQYQQAEKRHSEKLKELSEQLTECQDELSATMTQLIALENQAQAAMEKEEHFIECERRLVTAQAACERMEKEHFEEKVALQNQVATVEQKSMEMAKQLINVKAELERSNLKQTQIINEWTEMYNHVNQENVAALARIKQLEATVADLEQAKATLTATVELEKDERTKATALVSEMRQQLEEANPRSVRKPSKSLQSQLPEHDNVLSKRGITNQPDTRVVSTPHKSDLINRKNSLKVEQLNLVDVSPPKDSNPDGRVLLWKGDVKPSMTGTGVSVQFSDVEIFDKLPAASVVSNSSATPAKSAVKPQTEIVVEQPVSAVKSSSPVVEVVSIEYIASPTTALKTSLRKRLSSEMRSPKSPRANPVASMSIADSVAVDAPSVTNTEASPMEDVTATSSAPAVTTQETAVEEAKKTRKKSKLTVEVSENVVTLAAPAEEKKRTSRAKRSAGKDSSLIEVPVGEKENSPLPTSARASEHFEESAAPKTEQKAGRRKLFSSKRTASMDDSPIQAVLTTTTPVARRTRASRGALPSVTALNQLLSMK